MRDVDYRRVIRVDGGAMLMPEVLPGGETWGSYTVGIDWSSPNELAEMWIADGVEVYDVTREQILNGVYMIAPGPGYEVVELRLLVGTGEAADA